MKTFKFKNAPYSRFVYAIAPLFLWSFISISPAYAAASEAAVDGTCGSINDLTTNTKPSSDLCSRGASSAVTGVGPWNWTCEGSSGGSTSSCMALTPASFLPAYGVNLSGLEFGNAVPAARFNYNYTSPSEKEIVYYNSRSMTIARVPFKWERMQPTVGGAFDADYLGYVKTVVNDLAAKNMTALLDLHNYGARCVMFNAEGTACLQSATVGSAELASKEFWRFWSNMAKTFASSPNVAFDLMNEPHLISAADWANEAQEAIMVIRSANFKGYIFVEGGGSYSSATGFVSSGWAAEAVKLHDPLDKLIFEPHDYMDSDHSGTHDTCHADYGSTDLVAATQFARTNKLKLFLGEIGFSNDPTCTADNAELLGYLKDNQDVWVGMTAWGGGPWWGQKYQYNLDPVSLAAPYDDLPQMSLIWKWLLSL